MRSLLFLLREFAHSLGQNRFLHFTYGAQVTVSLLVLGIFFVLLVGAAISWSKLGEQMRLHIYLRDDLSAAQINSLQAQLGGMEHVAGVTYRSKEEALRHLSETTRLMPLSDLQMDNPLPDSFIVKATRPDHIRTMARTAEAMTGVESVRYGQDILERYMKVLLILISVCALTITLLILFTYSSINNIIGLSVYARRNEIRIMQLVGATWWMIRWPFLFEGIFFGVSGALIALGLITGLLIAMAQALRLSELSLALPQVGVSTDDILLGLAVLLVGLGLIVGFFGSLRTVNTFLRRETSGHIAPARRQAVG